MQADKHQSFLQADFNTWGINIYKVILSLLMGVVKHSESTESSKFAISLQCFKREVRDGTYFLHADKHQGFYELTLKFLMEAVMHAQSAQNRSW